MGGKSLILAILLLTCSCLDPQPDATFPRDRGNFSSYISPTERMQAGLEKNNSDYYYSSSEDSEDDYSSKDDEYIIDGQYSGNFKIGNPYQIADKTYIPKNYQDFEETGTASWYGPAFHGKATANGETYNSSAMTAAHPTIPLPSMVRVTNLKNDKSVIVRVNDRGPFSKNRIIDVSEKAATMLAFKNQGTTKVKIQLLREETNQLLKKLQIQN